MVHRKRSRRTVHLNIAMVVVDTRRVCEVINLQEGLVSLLGRQACAFSDDVGVEGLDAAFGEFLSAGLASMLVPIAGVIEFGTALEVLEDEGW